MLRSFHRLLSVSALVAIAFPTTLTAQSRVGSDSATRLTRFGRDVAYGTVEGLGFAGLDQWRDDPVEWQRGWRGYGQRAASNIGEFYIQEGVTEGLAALMDRPLDYTRCRCRDVGDRAWWALKRSLFDQLPRGGHALAVPRIAGAYAGSFAQATWRPTNSDRATVALLNGTTSLAIGAVINLYHEFTPWRPRLR